MVLSYDTGQPKLWIYDLHSHEFVRVYEFPPDVACPSSNYLNDIVVDRERQIAYIR